MPRSGTTLAEQIIASHPEAYGAGELKLLHQTLRFKMLNSDLANSVTFTKNIEAAYEDIINKF